MMPGGAIGTGSQVRLHLALWLPDGTEILSTFDEEPIECSIGDGTLEPGLEQSLFGLRAGERHELLLTEGVAFGDRDPDLVHELERSEFPGDMVLEPGQVINFQLPNGMDTPGQIEKVTDATVLVDFNHPLAGQALRIQVAVLDVWNPHPEG
jgi:FKBP-type peptidyl-prolyl cis-trans isomerase SlpA